MFPKHLYHKLAGKMRKRASFMALIDKVVDILSMEAGKGVHLLFMLV